MASESHPCKASLKARPATTKTLSTLLQVVLIFAGLPFGMTQTLDFKSFPPNCIKTNISSQYLNATIGWPHRLSCGFFVEKYKTKNTREMTVCQIWNETGTLLYNATASVRQLGYWKRLKDFCYVVDDIQETSRDFVMAFYVPDKGLCNSSNVRLHLVDHQSQQCQAVQPPPNDDYIVGQRRILSCASGFYKSLVLALIDRGANVTWRRNCSSLPPGANVDERNGELEIKKASYDHAGVYVCSITYNGLERYFSAYSICMKHAFIPAADPLLTCTSRTIKANPGGDVTFRCTADLGKGYVRKLNSFDFLWWKVDNDIEHFSCLIKSDAKTEDGVSCYYEFEEAEICYLHVASEEERKPPPVSIPLFFTIKNITEKIYGTYNVMLTLNFNGEPTATTSLTLERNPYPGLVKDATIIGTCIGVVCALLLLVGVISYNRIYIRVYWKRYFGAYTCDDKRDGAYLCYNFSKESDVFAQEYVKQAITTLRGALEGMGYRVHDERKDGFALGSRIENIQESIKNCHRVVILLNLQWIKDEWDTLLLQTSFKEMIESGSKLIFILLPGMKEYLKQHQPADHTCLVIKRAMQCNYAIAWSNKKTFNKKRFLIEVEDAMPKLKSQKTLLEENVNNAPAERRKGKDDDVIQLD